MAPRNAHEAVTSASVAPGGILPGIGFMQRRVARRQDDDASADTVDDGDVCPLTGLIKKMRRRRLGRGLGHGIGAMLASATESGGVRPVVVEHSDLDFARAMMAGEVGDLRRRHINISRGSDE